jgi:peroxiredoxin Q/BCP
VQTCAKRQANFKTKYGFQYPLLADEDKAVIEAFGFGTEKFMGKEYDGIQNHLYY